jgi:hypothetical protein
MRSSNAQHLPHATGSSANNPCIAKSCRTARSRSSQNAFALASAFADADADALVDARRASSSARNKWSTVRSHASSVRTRAASSVPATTVAREPFHHPRRVGVARAVRAAALERVRVAARRARARLGVGAHRLARAAHGDARRAPPDTGARVVARRGAVGLNPKP